MKLNLPDVWLGGRVLGIVMTSPSDCVVVVRITVGEEVEDFVLEIGTSMVVVMTWPSDCVIVVRIAVDEGGVSMVVTWPSDCVMVVGVTAGCTVLEMGTFTVVVIIEPSVCVIVVGIAVSWAVLEIGTSIVVVRIEPSDCVIVVGMAVSCNVVDSEATTVDVMIWPSDCVIVVKIAAGSPVLIATVLEELVEGGLFTVDVKTSPLDEVIVVGIAVGKLFPDVVWVVREDGMDIVGTLVVMITCPPSELVIVVITSVRWIDVELRGPAKVVVDDERDAPFELVLAIVVVSLESDEEDEAPSHVLHGRVGYVGMVVRDGLIEVVVEFVL
jgi:hypothetical protein